jgi:phage tail sheath protein FI
MTGPGLLAGGPPLADIDVVRPRVAYRTPGIHVEFARAGRAISPRRTDIAGLVGIAARGPLFTPVKVQSWGEFVATFGRHIPAGYLAYCVEAFFANGGRTVWVVRVAHASSARAATVSLADDWGRPSVLLTAVGPGRWAHRMTATVIRADDRFDLTLRGPDGLVEIWRDLGTTGSRNVVDVLNATATGSGLVAAWLPPEQEVGSPAPAGPRAFSGGAEGLLDLTAEDVVRGIAELERIDELAIVAAPDLQAVSRAQPVSDPPPHRCDRLDATDVQAPPDLEQPEFPPPLDVTAGQAELIAQCERTRERFAVLDPPLAVADPQAAIEWRNSLSQSPYAGAYFPWVLAPDPLRLAGQVVRAVPPCGHVVGVYARVDRAVGVHKAPANEVLQLAADVGFRVDDVTHGDANAAGLNIIRDYDGRGITIAGARTLAAGPPWRFVNVRRLVAMVEEAIGEDLGWAVFEPNGPDVWAEIDRAVRGFLDELWRAGMLDGASAAEAFDVRCDDETNPPDQVDLGRLTCLIALRPTPPAEFVVVRVTLSAESVATTSTGVPRG